MVSRIEVIPTEVRGYGNIIIPKTSSDFIGKYNDIYTNINGDFVLAYGDILLKITTTVSDSIKGLTANLNVIVTKRDDNTPIEDIVVGCKIDGTSLTNETTDENGECDFSWTPGEVGDSTILITIQQQDDYAGLTETKEITIGLLLSFNNIMNDLRLEDDELYVADISQQIESRTQLNPFVKDIWVAKGGEPIVDEYGIVHIAEKGDLIVELDSLDQLSEYDNVLFEGDVELLTGAVYDMELSEDYELIVNCLEREDIIGDSPVPTFDGVTLTSDKTILSYADSDTCTLTAQLLDGSSSASVSGVTVEFFNGSTSLGTATTNSSGVATKSYSSTGAGDVSLTAGAGTFVSEIYELQDCMLYDATEYSRTGTGSATSVATNNKSWDNTIDWELTADIKVTGNSCRIDVVAPTESLKHHLGIGKNGSGQLSTYVGKASSGEEAQTHSQSMSNNIYYTVKVVKEGTTVKFYFEGTLIRTDSSTASSWIGNYSTESVKFTTWASNTIYMKNLSVKPL